MQVGAGIKQMRSKGVAEGVSAVTPVLEACLFHGRLYIELYAATMHTLAFCLSFKQISDRPDGYRDCGSSREVSSAQKTTARCNGLYCLFLGPPLCACSYYLCQPF